MSSRLGNRRIFESMRRLPNLLLIASRYPFMNIDVPQQGRQLGQAAGSAEEKLKRTIAVRARCVHMVGKRRCRVFILLYASPKNEFRRFHTGLGLAVGMWVIWR